MPIRFFTPAVSFLSLCISTSFCGQTMTTPPPPAHSQSSPSDQLFGPQITPGHVVFRLYAPSAHAVMVRTEGPESVPGATPGEVHKASLGLPLIRGSEGIWTSDVTSIPPGVYVYTFSVDGVETADPRNPDTEETLNGVQSVFEVPGARWLDYRDDVPHGALATVFYHSKALGQIRRMHVYTPPGYEKGDKAYPVLYLLHGATGTDESWPVSGRAGAILDNLIAAGKVVPMIVIMPAGHMSRHFAYERGPQEIGHDAFTPEMVESVIPYIDQHYRTLTDRSHRAIAGLSMGGIQTLTLALGHPAMFAYAGVFSSGFFAETRAQEEATTLAAYKASGLHYKLFWFDSGDNDVARQNCTETAALLSRYGIPAVLRTSPGFHAWNNWRDYLVLFAPQLFQP